MVGLYRDKYRVESARLKGWDYTADGWYFVTVCTRGRECFFGEIVDWRMWLSNIGDTALRYWKDIPNHSANASLDAFVIMPNHLHGIVIIKRPTTDHRRDVACNVSTTTTANGGAYDGGDLGTAGGSGGLTVPPKRGSLGAIVRSYKSAVTRWCHMNGYTSFAWQPRFYDRVIRDRAALQNIRRYSLDNPAKWELNRNVGRWLTRRAARRRTRP
jgi:REP element-mobilizing transposase RayT